jgi:glycosyltransferase involved in cell wall biosynthesis
MNRPLKLAFISHPESTHTRRWLNWFGRHGQQVILFADAPWLTPWEGVAVHDLTRYFNRPVIRYALWTLTVRRLLRLHRPDILHAHRVSSAGWLGAASGFHPFVVTPWGSDLYLHPQRLRAAAWLARQALRRADLVTADSRDLVAQAVAFGAEPGRVEVIQWGVEFSVFHPAANREALRRQLGWEAGPVILSPRGLERVYNLGVIIAAFAELRRRQPAARLVLRAYNANLEYQAELEQQIERLGLGQSVEWIGVLEPWEKTALLYQAADVAVSVPSSDGTPVSVLEAMACGVPVVASDLPSLREWIEERRSGRLVAPGDVKALANALDCLLSDPATALGYAQEARKIVRSRADHHLEMTRMLTLYRELASTTGGRR